MMVVRYEGPEVQLRNDKWSG